jgi:hypothetical protein
MPGTDLSPVEGRLSLLADECAEIVRRWNVTSERHAQAVARFEAHINEWSEAGSRLQEDASHRIQELQRLIHQEWGELKQLHEEPVRQLAEHATSLTQVCIATASTAQQGFERSEARLAAIEGELNRHLTELTRGLQAVVVELRANHSMQPRVESGPSPWPLEGVARIHDQLRDGTDASSGASADDAPPPPDVPAESRPVAGLLPDAASLTVRIESLERALTDQSASAREADDRNERSTRAWRAAVAGLALLTVVAGAFAWRLSENVGFANAQAEQARQERDTANAEASRQMAAMREQAVQQIEEARRRLDRAQIVGNVLAAPDVIRYNLVGRAALRGASAQVHWSPSQGLVFSGSGMPAAAAGSTYKVWLLTRAGAVGAGTFDPDGAGTATVAGPPPALPRAVISAFVTLEPKAGSETPSGTALLARAPAAPPAETIQ